MSSCTRHLVLRVKPDLVGEKDDVLRRPGEARVAAGHDLASLAISIQVPGIELGLLRREKPGSGTQEHDEDHLQKGKTSDHSGRSKGGGIP